MIAYAIAYALVIKPLKTRENSWKHGITMGAVKESNINLEVDSEALGRYLSLINTEEILRTLGIDHLCPKGRSYLAPES